MQDDMMAMRKDNPLRRNDYWSPIGDTKVMATKNALRLVLINYLYVMGLYHDVIFTLSKALPSSNKMMVLKNKQYW